MPTLKHHGRLAAWLATAALLVAACGPDSLTNPTRRAHTPLATADVAPDDDPGGGGGELGPVPIRVPKTNRDLGAVPWYGTGLRIPAYSSFVVKVDGSVRVDPNPAVACYGSEHLPPYGAEGSYGPLGISYYSQLVVGIGFQYVRNGATGWVYGGIHGDGGSSASSDTSFTDKELELWVMRSGLYGEIGGMFDCPPAGLYSLSGEQTASVTILDGVLLDVNPKVALVKKGTKVEFRASASDGTPITQANWVFMPASTGVPAGICGGNPCAVTAEESGTIRVSRELKGLTRSAKAAIRIYSTFTLAASEAEVNAGDAVIFTPMVDGEPGSAARWEWRDNLGNVVENPCYQIVGGKCEYNPEHAGTMWAFVSTEEGSEKATASVAVRGNDDPPLTVRIVSATYPRPHESFTTAAGENVIQLVAEASDPTRNGEIKWEVEDDPDDRVESLLPATPRDGPSTTLTILGDAASDTGTPRWRALQDVEPGELDQKKLKYRVRAFVSDKGAPVYSEWKIVEQSIYDVIRQEYIDFAQPSIRWPTEMALGNPYSSPNFGAAELIATSDFSRYGLGWVAEELTLGLEQVRTNYDNKPIGVTAGYRDPVHNWVHVHLHQGKDASKTSNHMYGYAADLSTGDASDMARRQAVFEALATAAAPTGACIEPPKDYFIRGELRHGIVKNWDHVHVDWTPQGKCVPGWREYAASLITPAR